MKETKHGLGLLPQLPDIRDKALTLSVPPASETPDNYDLRPLHSMPGVYDQLDEGSCTANGAGFLIDFARKEQEYPWIFTPSRQFIYWNTRDIMGTVDQDSGATIRDAIKSIAKFGACPEDGNPEWSWPYSKDYKEKPIDRCYKDARLHVALTYEAVPQDSDTIKGLLVQHVPVIIGFTVHNSFLSKEVASTGIMPKPHFLDSIAGGHCVVVVGYITNNEMGHQGIEDWAICRNSWGDKWGQDGYFLMPWKEVLLNRKQATDFWCIHSVGFSKAAS